VTALGPMASHVGNAGSTPAGITRQQISLSAYRKLRRDPSRQKSGALRVDRQAQRGLLEVCSEPAIKNSDCVFCSGSHPTSAIWLMNGAVHRVF
jgi:hypothetical protein